jgi:hypothetical protein
MATKRIKLLKPWMMTPAGAEVEFQTSVADLLIQRGRAVEVKPPEPKPEPAPPKISKKSARREAKNAKLHR